MINFSLCSCAYYAKRRCVYGLFIDDYFGTNCIVWRNILWHFSLAQAAYYKNCSAAKAKAERTGNAKAYANAGAAAKYSLSGNGAAHTF